MPRTYHRVVFKHKHFLGSTRGLPVPRAVSRFVMHYGNIICCHLFGHDDVLWHIREELPSDERIECVHCLRPITRCLGPRAHQLGRKKD